MTNEIANFRKDLLENFRKLKDEMGSIKVDDITRGITCRKEELKSIFDQYAMLDGNNELSESEFEQAINTEEFLNIVIANTQYKLQLFQDAQNPSVGNGREGYTKPRDLVVAEKGEQFAEQIWDPMNNLANEALAYLQEHGNIEGFSFTGFPLGVTLIDITIVADHSDVSNDTMTFKDGQAQVVRNADSARVAIVFKHENTTYELHSNNSINDPNFLSHYTYHE